MNTRPLLLLFFLILFFPQSAPSQEDPRNTFPGRRVGGGTRGDCSSRFLAHLVPPTSVFSPSHPAELAFLLGPAHQPYPLQVLFKNLRTSGSSDSAIDQSREIIYPPLGAGILLINAPSIGVSTILESTFVCQPSVDASPQTLDFVQASSPPAVTLLLPKGQVTAQDHSTRQAIKLLKNSCSKSISVELISQQFSLAGFFDSSSWPKSLPVYCL